MRWTDEAVGAGSPTGHGALRHAPPRPGTGRPEPPGTGRALAGAAPGAEPLGGGPALRAAACGYWARRGLATAREQVVAAPGGAPLLLALAAALGGDLLLPRPCPAWWLPQAPLLGRTAHPVATPAECGGVPDPYALWETVRRIRDEGGDPRLLVLAVVDDPTGTAAPPELLHQAVAAATEAGLHVVSDETWRDTVHPVPAGRAPVLAGPAGMLPAEVTVLTDLAGALLPGGWPVAVARFPATDRGAVLHDEVLDVLAGTGAVLAAPVAAAGAHALAEPEEVVAQAVDAARVHGRLAAALHGVLRTAGALALPPCGGRQLYADLGPLGEALAARGVGDAQELEDHLTGLLGFPVPGGHRFGDDPAALRVRLDTAAFLGATAPERTASLTAADPLDVPAVRDAVTMFAAVLDGLRADARRADAQRRERPR
ncbi:aminotransferase class I/II-fold pyridoxal phosphate-dependent enzyme [Streptomyces sp. LE64]|uniref:aminotransferase class I/II-fold pyridoxal phosphate-dependent enzyme n=1 Tax=Streptomyces sp. LE64 TaxID=3448653 RepID=UPI004042BC3C